LRRSGFDEIGFNKAFKTSGKKTNDDKLSRLLGAVKKAAEAAGITENVKIALVRKFFFFAGAKLP